MHQSWKLIFLCCGKWQFRKHITLILKAYEFEYKIYQILLNCPSLLTLSHPLEITMETLRFHARKKHNVWECFHWHRNYQLITAKNRRSPTKTCGECIKVNFLRHRMFSLCDSFAFSSFELFARRKNWIKFKWQINMTQYDFLLIS